MSSEPAPPLHTQPIAQRPRKSWAQLLHAALFVLVFDVGCLMVNGFQFAVLLPLRALPGAGAAALYDAGMRYSKGAFGTLLGALSPRAVLPGG